MESKETIKIREDIMVDVQVNGKTYTVNKVIEHFIEILKLLDRELNMNQIISDFSSFVSHWDTFQKIKSDEASMQNDNYQSRLPKFILGHTIKPKTQYANQQEKEKNGKNRIYPITGIRDSTEIESMAMGRNYPIRDCVFYVVKGNNWIKLK